MIRLIGGLMCLLVAGGLIALDAAEAQARDGHRPIRVITHNIAGGALNHGHPRALNAVERQIRKFDPDVVMMQEVCASQRDEFARRHPGWTVLWTENRYSHPLCDGDPDPATTDPDSCDVTNDCAPNGDEVGSVLASRHALSNRQEWMLPYPRLARTQTLLCADLRVRGINSRACVTHIAAAGVEKLQPGIRAAQFGRVLRIVGHGWRRKTVLAGDFNSGPRDPWIRQAYRRFEEVDQNRRGRFRPTHRRANTSPTGRSKIDFAFVGRTGARKVRGATRHGGYSDHRLVLGTGWFRR